MKRVRITYEGAYHHVMNRGINGEKTFFGNKNKVQFVDYSGTSERFRRAKVFGN